LAGIIPTDSLQTAVNDLEQVFSEFGNSTSSAICDLNSTDRPLLHKIHTQTSNLLSLCSAVQSATKFAQRLVFGKQPPHILSSGYLLGIPGDRRLTYNFHQESNYIKGFEQIINLHFPLIDKADLSNGTMSILSQSHKLGNLDYHKKRFSGDSYTDLIPVGIENIVSEFEEIHLELEPGDCVFFDGNLIHRSNFNSSDRCRLAGVVRLTTGLALEHNRQTPEEL
jgi:ectoine hydroxylase-related dioxygenase (phytanoyl-CoA dioxygenase family)